MREMKYHIFNENKRPLCWGDRAIEFNSEFEAIDFLKALRRIYPDFKIVDAEIKEVILYYDGGYISGREAMKLMNEKLNK